MMEHKPIKESGTTHYCVTCLSDSWHDRIRYVGARTKDNKIVDIIRDKCSQCEYKTYFRTDTLLQIKEVEFET